MRFKMNRLCELAGIPMGSQRGKLLRENVEDQVEDQVEEEYSLYEDEAEPDADDDEEIEVDEVELVQELRRAKRIMQEGKRKAVKRKQRRNQNLQEVQLKAIIDQEVKNIIKELDLNLNSGWIYGNKKPTKSKKGYSHQGSFLKGVGFK
jgi:hypothetical protein